VLTREPGESCPQASLFAEARPSDHGDRYLRRSTMLDASPGVS
jgi:hypothetical protein